MRSKGHSKTSHSSISIYLTGKWGSISRHRRSSMKTRRKKMMSMMLINLRIFVKRRWRIKGMSLKALMGSLMRPQWMKRGHLAKRLRMRRRGQICRNSWTWILILRLSHKISWETSLNWAKKVKTLLITWTNKYLTTCMRDWEIDRFVSMLS
jgi:hypothetical protein